MQYRNLADMYNLSRPAEDLVRRLMEVYPQHRITALRGAMDVKGHPWLRHIGASWKDVEEGRLPPPFQPGNEDDENVLASLGNSGGDESIEHTQNRMTVENIGTDYIDLSDEIMSALTWDW
ncbi:hypothetical protein HDU96_003858 [Phlyctochytrium bullatum]|nr:hypothetical protein HDU96_003858 [Phlyctochytrium bullatum]